jgi:hypothetical protein
MLGDVDICLDGVPLKGVQRLSLYMESDDINRLTIDFAVRDIDVDPDVLTVIEALARERAAA